MRIETKPVCFRRGFAVAVIGWSWTLPAAELDPTLHILETPRGTRYGLFSASAAPDSDRARGPAPTLFVFATSIESMGKNRIYSEAGRQLGERGWLYVTLDPPCHGRDARDGEPAHLSGWAARVEQGEDLLGPFVARCRDVLDHLVQSGLTDPARVAATGTSRGGFCALHFAAAEPRVRAVAAVSPVTDPLVLREFASVAEAKAAPLKVSRLGSALADRAVWVSIGDQDARVGTDQCVAAVRKLASARSADAQAPIELLVGRSAGHSPVRDAYTLAARFLGAHAPESDSGEGRSRTILLVDDHDVLYSAGLERVLGEAERHDGNPVIRNDKPWEVAIGYCSVLRDPSSGKYRLWYQAYSGSKAEDPTRRVVVGYAESKDGLKWDKPALGLYDYNGESDTNIVLVGNGLRSVNYGVAIHHDPHDARAERRYKMAYWDFVRHGDVDVPGLCVAFSADGLRWNKHPTGPLLRAAYGEPSPPPLVTEVGESPMARPAVSDVIDLTWDPARRSYVLYTKTWIDSPTGARFWKRAVVRSESKNFTVWSRPQLVMAPAPDDPGQIHGAPVFYRHGVYFALVQRLDFGGHDSGGSGNMPTELAFSRDGLDWERPFADVMFLPVTGDGKTFDAGCLWTNAMPLFLDDEVRFYYGAYPGWNSDFERDVTGIGMARLPLDRFVALRPTENVGQLTLKPRRLGREVLLNANAEGGKIQVEVLSAEGYRVPGFTRDDAVAIERDGLRQKVAWKEKALADLPRERYQLRLHVENAKLYAVTID